jgi:hypothetical protein
VTIVRAALVDPPTLGRAALGRATIGRAAFGRVAFDAATIATRVSRA